MTSFTHLTARVDEVKRAYDSIQMSMKELEVGGEEILKAMNELNEVSARVGRSSRKMRDQSFVVGESVDKVQRVSGEVTGGVKEIASGLEQVNTTMEHLVDLSREISRIGDRLDQSISVFTVEDSAEEPIEEPAEELIEELYRIERLRLRVRLMTLWTIGRLTRGRNVLKERSHYSPVPPDAPMLRNAHLY